VDSVLQANVACLRVSVIPLDTVGQRAASAVAAGAAGFPPAEWLLGAAVAIGGEDSIFVVLHLNKTRADGPRFSAFRRVPRAELPSAAAALLDSVVAQTSLRRARCGGS
jgi:hypothetical protein